MATKKNAPATGNKGSKASNAPQPDAPVNTLANAQAVSRTRVKYVATPKGVEVQKQGLANTLGCKRKGVEGLISTREACRHAILDAACHPATQPVEAMATYVNKAVAEFRNGEQRPYYTADDTKKLIGMGLIALQSVPVETPAS